ncbi:MAG: HAD family phosphatase [Candidatus Omnitrophica bacterium]|nr:HAD family phosphatase [Candidatus Omnitrophota bacterium]
MKKESSIRNGVIFSASKSPKNSVPMHFKISTIIFDMDGVITDTMPYHFQAWEAVFACEGITVSHEDIYKREGQKGIDSVREIFHEKKKIYTDRVGRKILKMKEDLFKKIFQQKFIAGSRGFIKNLKNRGFVLGLVTGTSRTEAKKLLPPDLWDCFTATVCGCDVQNGKPHPEPYLKALQKLKIKPADAIVFENAPFGIRSARAAGLFCLALETSLPRSYLKEADAVFSSYKEIRTKVKLIKS